MTFQSTLPVWGATGAWCTPQWAIGVSIHAPRVGSDWHTAPQSRLDRRFNPRSPCGERPFLTPGPGGLVLVSIHAPRVGSDPQGAVCFTSIKSFNPRSPCGERPGTGNAPRYDAVSIHAPRVGSDSGCWSMGMTKVVSIHAPRVGSDFLNHQTSSRSCEFQSTLPVWGATGLIAQMRNASKFQSTLPVWGATIGEIYRGGTQRVSIHAPRVGSDPQDSRHTHLLIGFNPRSPCGERRLTSRGILQAVSFNPRSPCGERPMRNLQPCATSSFQSTLPVWGATIGLHRAGGSFGLFQSTLPVWGATWYSRSIFFCRRVSIHAPRVGSDQWVRGIPKCSGRFNPRSPCGERHGVPRPHRGEEAVSIHAPRVGSDSLSGMPCLGDQSFNPRSPCGERPMILLGTQSDETGFQSTLPVWGATEEG